MHSNVQQRISPAAQQVYPAGGNRRIIGTDERIVNIGPQSVLTNNPGMMSSYSVGQNPQHVQFQSQTHAHAPNHSVTRVVQGGSNVNSSHTSTYRPTNLQSNYSFGTENYVNHDGNTVSKAAGQRVHFSGEKERPVEQQNHFISQKPS